MQQEFVIEQQHVVIGTLRAVSFKTSSLTKLEADIIRLSPSSVVFEIFYLQNTLRLSEVLTDFKLLSGDGAVHSNKAVVRSLVDMGATTLVEVDLELQFGRSGSFSPSELSTSIGARFQEFLERWQTYCRILPEYKIAVSDLADYLREYRLWLDQVELTLNGLSTADRKCAEGGIAEGLRSPTAESVGALFEQYESVASQLPEDSAAFHRAYCRRLVQPLVLGSPFALRAVKKPLGYAGDYELVSMILRDPLEGETLFGKVMNQWFIDQPPAEAHRNRIKYLTKKLTEETARTVAAGRNANVFNVGCGPAQEIQQFFRETSLSDQVSFKLLDFNDETLNVAKTVLERARVQNGRRANIEFIRKSAAQLLRMKDSKGNAPTRTEYDFVYCAGLFDYLPDALCKQLTEVFYGMLRPGGLLVVTNVDSSNPIRHWLGDILEWHLIYRGHRELHELRPVSSDPEWVRVQADDTGVNIFLEVRKPGS